jgi:hypothetical protein
MGRVSTGELSFYNICEGVSARLKHLNEKKLKNIYKMQSKIAVHVYAFTMLFFKTAQYVSSFRTPNTD